MISNKTPFILYGGDYNPEQWPQETLKEDMRLFKKAGINTVTLPVFSWALLQPSEDTYSFQWLDKILEELKENNIYVCMATSTAVQPSWMSKKYPEILPTDFDGRKRKIGGRVNFCPNSEVYRKYSVKLATKLAERYKDYPNLIAWHIGNEYDNYCYCDHCEEKFQQWAKKQYNTIEAVNKAWNMNFWGHTLYSFEEITAPSGLSEMWHGYDKECTTFQGMALDYKRFMNDSILECYLGEYEALKAVTPDIKITTNFMGTFKPLDYFKWAKYMDIVSWDNYPGLNASPADVALRHDLMRGLKGGEPFMLIEQTPSQTNWHPYNSLKRPGIMKLLSYQAIAHGADTVMFFQMRQSIGACEKYHGAVISHAGHENTRVYREVSDLGEELRILGSSTLDSRYTAKAAIIFDWENWWAVELSSGPNVQLRYINQIEKYYKALHSLNVPVDFVTTGQSLDGYSLVIAPVLYMVKDEASKAIKTFVEAGGTLITTFFSGYVNENDLVTLGGYPGKLRDILGLWVEEIDALPPEMSNSIIPYGKLQFSKPSYSCGMVCDVINLEGAETLASYGSDFYQSYPVLTLNKYGSGEAYYIASDPEEAFVQELIQKLCAKNNLIPAFESPQGVEITRRYKEDYSITFLMNHNDKESEVALDKGRYYNLLTGKISESTLILKPNETIILKKNNQE